MWVELMRISISLFQFDDQQEKIMRSQSITMKKKKEKQHSFVAFLSTNKPPPRFNARMKTPPPLHPPAPLHTKSASPDL